MDWQHFIFDPTQDWLGKLNVLARKRFVHEVLADEAFNYALDKVSANDWQLLSRFSGKSSPGTFLVSVFRNQMEDFSRSKFGRPRPPAWLIRLGGLWKQVYEYLCLERAEPEQIVDRIMAVAEKTVEEVRSMIREVRGRITNCGESKGEINVQDEQVFENASSPTNSPQQELEHDEFNQCLGALAGVLEINQQSADGLTNKLADMPTIKLDDRDRIILKLVYQQGKKVAAVSRVLELPEHQVRRTIKKCHQQIRDVLTVGGISVERLFED